MGEANLLNAPLFKSPERCLYPLSLGTVFGVSLLSLCQQERKTRHT